MKISVERFLDDGDTTLSLVKVDNKFLCFGLEDPFREEKVHGQTRIPEGEYRVRVRTHGSFHVRYSQDKRFKAKHKGMLEVLDVPNFKHILIHVGNSNLDTKGCLLVGMGTSLDSMKISNSTKAYKLLYKTVIQSALADDLTITYYDMEGM